jgi:HSP20 family protein
MSMPVRRPSPFGEMLSLREAMDRLFEDSFVRPFFASRIFPTAAPIPINAYFTADDFVVEAELPGVKPEDVEITVEAGTLTISAEARAQEERRQGDYLIEEISRGRVSRSIGLPEGLQPDRATATFEHGVLTLRIPKAEEVKPRQIRITPTSHGSHTEASTPASGSGGR